MKRADLIAEFRSITRDVVKDYFFDDRDIERWLAQAEEEAAIRGRLLHESENPALCEIAVTAGVATYRIHSDLVEPDFIGIVEPGCGRRRPLVLTSTEELDRCMPDWRDRSGRVEYVVRDDVRLRLVPRPTTDATLALEGFRLPMNGLSCGRDEPEIHRAHHRYLVFWALYRGLSQPDAETLNVEQAADAEAKFTAYFGRRPDSDLRRSTRQDEPHHNVAWP